MKSVEQARSLTLNEYYYHQKAYELQQVDEEHLARRSAFYAFVVQQTKDKPGQKSTAKKQAEQVPVYPSLEDFFDYNQEIENVWKDKNKQEEDESEGETKEVDPVELMMEMAADRNRKIQD